MTRNKIKFRSLVRRLGGAEYRAVGVLELLWHVTAENALDGAIGRFSDEEIETALGWDGDRGQLVHALIETRWIDELPPENGRLFVHAWDQWADETVHRALVRMERLFANGAPPKTNRCTPDERTAHAAFIEECARRAHGSAEGRGRDKGQEQGQAQGKDNASPPGSSSSAGAADGSNEHEKTAAPATPVALVELWNYVCAPAALPAVKRLSSSRRRHIAARLREHPELGFWRDLFERIVRSRFLTGQVLGRNGSRPFRATFDWIVGNDGNLTKVLEGNYDDRDQERAYTPF